MRLLLVKLGLYLRLATEAERKSIVHLLFRRVYVGKVVERADPRNPFANWLASGAGKPNSENLKSIDRDTAR